MILISIHLCRYLITQSHLVYVARHTTAVHSDVYCIVAHVRSLKYVPGIQFDIMINSSLPAVSCLICVEYVSYARTIRYETGLIYQYPASLGHRQKRALRIKLLNNTARVMNYYHGLFRVMFIFQDNVFLFRLSGECTRAHCPYELIHPSLIISSIC